jgi:bis(5'-nucleosyl)-tetraphosphatase (symmetrical)
LLTRLDFRADRDELYFLGDLVNRGPQSLEVLRFIKAMEGNAHTVLGNHDLHLLAHCFDPERPLRRGDTLQLVLAASDRESLVQWLLQQPLALLDVARNDLFVHAGLVPPWRAQDALLHAEAAMRVLRDAPGEFLANMYGNQPERWDPALAGMERWRFIVNALTRLRYCGPDGTPNLKLKDSPVKTPAPWCPWFDHPLRQSRGARVIIGHWSTLGFVNRPDIVALDTGCVWGGKLTAVDLDNPDAPPIQVAGENSGNGEA